MLPALSPINLPLQQQEVVGCEENPVGGQGAGDRRQSGVSRRTTRGTSPVLVPLGRLGAGAMVPSSAAQLTRSSLHRANKTNIFEWHFTLRGAQGSEFESGLYHGRIILPAEYPFRPPSLMLLTPNGRWECNKKVRAHWKIAQLKRGLHCARSYMALPLSAVAKICLTFTGFHEEMWQPAWGIRTALLGVQAFMAARAEAATGVGSLDYPIDERKRLADRSRTWACPVCQQPNTEILPPTGERKAETLPEGLQVDTDRKQTTPASGLTEGQLSSPSSDLRDKAGAATQTISSLESPDQTTAALAAGGATASAVSSTAKFVPGESSEEIDSFNSSERVHLAFCEPVESTGPSPLRQRVAGANRNNATQEEHSKSTTQTVPRGSDSGECSATHLSSQSWSKLPRQEGFRPALPPQTLQTSLQHAAPPLAAPPIYGVEPLAVAAAAAANVRRPGPLTPSEARVSQLDRAILTVVLLLCGLVVRRLL